MADPASTSTDAPRAIGVKTVPTGSLKPNPHNPRRLFDKEPLKVLEDSIRKVGILVPLTVFKAAEDEKYTILDGQRRWICAENIELETVPVNEVEEPTLAQNIVTMFQIHKLRLDWELMPTALKLEVLMDELQERSDKPLAAHTGLDVAVVQRCKKLLWYPKKYQEMMLFAAPSDRVKADFFIELYPILNDQLVKKAEWYSRDKIIKRFLEKYRERKSGLKSITDFRKIKQYITSARKSGNETQILRKLQEYLDRDDLGIEHLEIAAAQIKKTSLRVARLAAKINGELSKIDSQDFYGEEDLWKEIEKLYKTIARKLRDADRRPT